MDGRCGVERLGGSWRIRFRDRERVPGEPEAPGRRASRLAVVRALEPQFASGISGKGFAAYDEEALADALSFNDTVRLNTGAPGRESGSAAKYP